MKRLSALPTVALLFVFTCLGADQPAAHAPVRIALLSDVHILHGTNQAAKALHRKHYAQAIREVNAAGVSLVLLAGDLTENGTPGEMGEFIARTGQLSPPVWFVPGNHDVGNKLIPGKQTKPQDNVVNEWRLRRFEMRWGSTFFVRERPEVRVVALNSSIFGTDFRREKKMWTMLEKHLAAPSDKPTIVLQHFPPFEKKYDEPGGVYWNVEPAPRQRLLTLFKQAGVKAVLSGHMHREFINRHDGILYVTSPPVSFGLPKNKQKPGWTLLTISPAGEVKSEFRHLAE